MAINSVFMGAFFRLQLVSEKPNCARLDAPALQLVKGA